MQLVVAAQLVVVAQPAVVAVQLVAEQFAAAVVVAVAE